MKDRREEVVGLFGVEVYWSERSLSPRVSGGRRYGQVGCLKSSCVVIDMRTLLFFCTLLYVIYSIYT